MRRLASFQLTSNCRLHVRVGDLTTFKGDAIVNAANQAMLGGGGVDGAIHRAAGPGLLKACREIPAIKGIRCPTGEAQITPGFKLPVKHVIHTVGPVFIDDETSEPLLASAYRNALAVANRQPGVREIAFPAISCGVYGYPVERAAAVAVRECGRGAGALAGISLVLFSDATARPFLRAAEAQLGQPLRDGRAPDTPPDGEPAARATDSPLAQRAPVTPPAARPAESPPPQEVSAGLPAAGVPGSPSAEDPTGGPPRATSSPPARERSRSVPATRRIDSAGAVEPPDGAPAVRTSGSPPSDGQDPSTTPAGGAPSQDPRERP